MPVSTAEEELLVAAVWLCWGLLLGVECWRWGRPAGAASSSHAWMWGEPRAAKQTGAVRCEELAGCRGRAGCL